MSLDHNLNGLDANAPFFIQMQDEVSCTQATTNTRFFRSPAGNGLDANPVTAAGQYNKWRNTASAIGQSVGGVDLWGNGFEAEQLAGHVVTVRADDGTELACGVLGEVYKVPSFATYPGYAGTEVVSGFMNLVNLGPTSIKMVWAIANSPANWNTAATEYGISIRMGQTCTGTDAQIGERLFVAPATDPWDGPQTRKIFNMFDMAQPWAEETNGLDTLSYKDGYSFYAHAGRAVVVSTFTGAPGTPETKIGCGLLEGSNNGNGSWLWIWWLINGF